MASEPVLRTGDGGEWVLFLQQSLNHHYQQQVTAESGEFDDALAGVVRHFQAQRGIAATGDADAATWQALTGARYRWPDEPVATAEAPAGDVVVHLALTLTGDATGGTDAIADLTVDLTADPPALACTGATFLPGPAELVDASTVGFTGTCALAGAADATGYLLAVAVVPSSDAASVAEWLERHAEPLATAGTVALPATAGLVEVP